MSRRTTFVVALVALLAVALGISGTVSRAQDATATREVLVTGKPVAAQGQVLQLQRVTIPAGVRLPVHVHPGMQAAWISSGVLTYTIVVGSAEVTRAPVNGTPGPVETLTDGTTTELRPGDSVVESEGLIHYAENRTDRPIEIVIASLLAEGEPGTIVVDELGTPVP